MSTEFRKRNHFVAEHYLKRWSDAERKVWTYRILVPHANVQTWKAFPLRSVAKRHHLYTRMAAGKETDDIERWLCDEFETPAEAVLDKATNRSRMSQADWQVLVRYLAAQDVRTPARFTEMMVKWMPEMPAMLQGVLDDLVAELEDARRTGVPPKNREPSPFSEYLPVAVNVGTDGDGQRTLAAETILGRGMWQFMMRTLLQSTIRHLMRHRWTILESPEGCSWPTSDDPVVKLNYNAPNKYDFGGGWGSTGSEIFMPLGPRQLLYTRIGHRPGTRGTQLTVEQFLQIRRFILEHSHRLVFAMAVEPDIEVIRPRTVDLASYQSEEKQWANWNSDQAVAERELRSKPR